jgi:UDP-N-acetylmuramate--alanine ligase
MKDLNNISKVYFLGIGGIGMSALARYFNDRGTKVSGYDRTSSPLTDTLQKEGIHIHFEDDITLLNKDADLVVYTPAIPTTHKQLNWYKENGFELLKRSQVLGLISKNHYCIAIAGSHGKTTVSSMVAHILNESVGCTAFLGGIASNFNSNYIHSSDKYMVVEADEFDRSFLTLHPNIAGITAIDSDHLEIYGSLEKIEDEVVHFANQIVAGGQLILNDQYTHIQSRLQSNFNLSFYGQESTSNCYLKSYYVEDGKFHFSVVYEGREIEGLVATFGGIHNLENTTLAISVCKELGLEDNQIREGIASFKGIKRRFEKHIDKEGLVYIDDYAHHPMEIKALMRSLKFLYPEREIVAIFQPHLFSRTQDLCAEFAAQLSVADELMLLPIYPAREEAIEGVSAELILDKVSIDRKSIVQKDELLERIKDIAEDKIIVTIGAGDIDRFVEPIKKMLS